MEDHPCLRQACRDVQDACFACADIPAAWRDVDAVLNEELGKSGVPRA